VVGKAASDHAGKSVIAMKILLQHERTQLYLRSLGNWTADPIVAYDFRHSRRAIEFAHEHSIAGVQVAIKFMGHEFNEEFAVPISSGKPAPAAV
jgi:hypothetical protein